MKTVKVQSLKNQEVIADKCDVAERSLDRLVGLVGKARLEAGRGMLFPKCSSIHMWFMRFPIDVVFLREGKVAAVHRGVRPWRPLPLSHWGATETLELPVGTIERCALEVGDEICLS